MIKLENYEVMGWEHVIRGMRNPMNSWEKSDSQMKCTVLKNEEVCPGVEALVSTPCEPYISIGPNDHELMMKLRNAGTDHRKFMRMITVYVDITAPLYWWKEFDTYKVGTVANSCSTMHKIHSKPIELTDFSIDNFNLPITEEFEINGEFQGAYTIFDAFDWLVEELESLRKKYLETKDTRYWRALIQLLPSSYEQKRTVMLNYEVLANIYRARKNHKLEEWHILCDWIEKLPYSEIITGEKEKENGFQN